MRPIWSRALGVTVALSLAACQGSAATEGSASPPAGEPGPIVADGGGVAIGSVLEPVPGLRDGVYRGLGTWIDIYDEQAWRHPTRTVRSMAAQGVRTIYLQTSNFHRHRPFVHREGVDAFLESAHRYGLAVVAWYLPGFRDVQLDLRRALRAIFLVTRAGERFDSFALDIESSEVRRPAARTSRLLRLSERIRQAAGPRYPLGAIVASPRRMRTDAGYWPGFPWRELATTFDVFLPMTYYTYRVSGREDAAWYTAKNVLIIRQETSGMNVPIHVIGGISFDATGPETRGFVDTILDREVIGASYYTFPGTTAEQWDALRAID